MTEDYLQFLWAAKRILKTDLILTDGTPVRILNFGKHNTLLKGPDFIHASIEMHDLKFHGTIEIHVKSSDWDRHGHTLDPQYNNVILHVVYEHDAEVIQNGRKLPVLELKNMIDSQHYETFQKFSNSDANIICRNFLPDLDPVFIRSMMLKSLYRKLAEKVKTIESIAGTTSRELYYYLGAAFGTNLNKGAFLELLRRVSASQLKGLSVQQRYSLLTTEIGILTKNGSIGGEQWHFRGNRPQNFPTVRLRQFAAITSGYDFEFVAKANDPNTIIQLSKTLIRKYNMDTTRIGTKISKQFEENIIINGVVPYLWHLGECREDSTFQDGALDVLAGLPPESNRFVKKWKEAGFLPENALESQGLIALYRYYCCHKKCLSCEVGSKVLNNA